MAFHIVRLNNANNDRDMIADVRHTDNGSYFGVLSASGYLHPDRDLWTPILTARDGSTEKSFARLPDLSHEDDPSYPPRLYEVVKVNRKSVRVRDVRDGSSHLVRVLI